MRLKQVRELLGYKKQTDFALSLDIPFRTYQTYEQGQTKIPHTFLSALSSKYNISIDWLLSGEGSVYITEKQNINNLNEVLTELIKELSEQRKEYYFHRIKADLLEFN